MSLCGTPARKRAKSDLEASADLTQNAVGNNCTPPDCMVKLVLARLRSVLAADSLDVLSVTSYLCFLNDGNLLTDDPNLPSKLPAQRASSNHPDTCNSPLISDLLGLLHHLIAEDQGKNRSARHTELDSILLTVLCMIASGQLHTTNANEVVQCCMQLVSKLTPSQYVQGPSLCAAALRMLLYNTTGERDADKFQELFAPYLTNPEAVEIIKAAWCQPYDFDTQQAALDVAWSLMDCNVLPAQLTLFPLADVAQLLRLTLLRGPEFIPASMLHCVNHLFEIHGKSFGWQFSMEYHGNEMLPLLIQMLSWQVDMVNALGIIVELIIHKLVPTERCIQAGLVQVIITVLRGESRDDEESSNAAADVLYQLVVFSKDWNLGLERALLSCSGHDVLLSAVASGGMFSLVRIAIVIANTIKTPQSWLRCLCAGAVWRMKQRLHLPVSDIDPMDYAIRASPAAWIGTCSEALVLVVREHALAPEILRALHRHSHVSSTWLACWLACHAPMPHLRTILVEHGALRLLCHRLGSAQLLEGEDEDHDGWRAAADSLHQLLHRFLEMREDRLDTLVSSSATPEPGTQTLLPASLVNQPKFSDVTFMVEGRSFYAHRVAVASASPAFGALLDGSFAEAHNPTVPIPNVAYEVWEVLMRYIYTGNAEVLPDMAKQVLVAADQYLLEGLKGLAQQALLATLDCSVLPGLLALTAQLPATPLEHGCLEMALHHWAEGETITQLQPGPEPGQTDAEMRQHVADRVAPWLLKLLDSCGAPA